ncbi:MAG: hypothetical protein NXI20_00985 [bacterium]|nr:hypothetical protein [bacterium]
MKASKFLEKHGYKFQHLGEKVFFKTNLFKLNAEKKTVVIDGINRKVELNNSFGLGPKFSFEDIDTIFFTSRILRERPGPTNRTVFDYKKQILIRLKNKKEIPIFTFISERVMKEKQIDQITDWLKKVLGTGQPFSSK